MPSSSPPESPLAAPRGAYGLALTGPGLDPATWSGVAAAPDDWPMWTLRRHLPRSPSDERATHVSAETAELALFHGGAVRLDRAARTIDLHVGADESPHSLIHPWLSGVFAVTTLWAGGLALHGGVCLIDGRAWVLFGVKGSGKSTTLAALARAGVPVLADDLAAIVEGQALVGPRYVDLRRTSSALFPEAEAVGRLGLRHRWRLPLGEVPSSAPLGGFVVLDWADGFRCDDVPVAERLPMVLGAGTLPVAPAEPASLLELIGLPVVRASRRRSIDELDAWASFLVAELAARS